ncbi:hypothetical protein MHBO_002638 [Bonamia ostreae]|uniref:RNA-dependent RNA polymerase n=1 Tax=Bonamia ostreae TaxID=126728 RepID=A0ABV2ANF6_9EUKA
MRILTCVDPGDEYAHLIDVLVFPTDSQSARPHSDEMSGGDLDGDLYWCCWDPSLMPSRTVDAFDYSGPKAPIPRKSLSSETRERIDFFSQHDTDLLGTIDSLYFEFADRFKANCPECQELNHIFSNVVDYQPKYAKKTINQLRAKLRTIQERPRNFIWRRIEEENKKLRKEMSPNFGIVRIGHGDFMNNYGEKRNIEIFVNFKFFKMFNSKFLNYKIDKFLRRRIMTSRYLLITRKNMWESLNTVISLDLNQNGVVLRTDILRQMFIFKTE